jgi:hypothetical protein
MRSTLSVEELEPRNMLSSAGLISAKSFLGLDPGDLIKLDLGDLMGQVSNTHGTAADLRSVAILGDKASYTAPSSPATPPSIQTPTLVKLPSSEIDALFLAMSIRPEHNTQAAPNFRSGPMGQGFPSPLNPANSGTGGTNSNGLANFLASSPPLSTKSGVSPLVTSPLTIYSTAPSLTEGISNSSILVATFNDSDGNAFSTQYSAMINWGDGQSSAGAVSGGAAPAAPTRSSVTPVGLFQVNGSHTYAEEGTYTITVTINDTDGATGTGTSTANVADAALSPGTSLSLDAAPGVPLTAIVANFKDADPGGTVSDYTATITWGDGHTSPGTIAANSQGGFAVTGTNTYAASGLYNFSVAIQDVGGSKTTATGTVAVVAVTLTMPNGTYVPVNADNDNGSVFKAPGIPTTRDLNSFKTLTKVDPELQQVNIAVTPGGVLPGSFRLTFSTAGTGSVRLWTDANKTSQIVYGATWLSRLLPPSFFVEGLKSTTATQGPGGPSTPLDVTISLVYSVASGGSVTGKVDLAVTPVVNSFTVTPAAGQNINFIELAPMGPQGLTAQAIVGGAFQPGEVVKADVRNGSNVTMHFVQNITEAKNGANGSAAGFVYTAASSLANLNLVPDTTQNPTLTFPCLDSLSNSPTDYHNFTTTATATGVVIQGDDSPGAWGPNNNDKLAIIDYRLSFRVYLVAEYADGSLYSLGYINWVANFWADTNVPGTGVSVIKVPKGVTADATWTASNVDPAQTNPPIYNNGMTYN